MTTSRPHTQQNVSYGSHPLQTYSLTILDPSQPRSKLWIMSLAPFPFIYPSDPLPSYIHGGAWRDPRITSTSFSASQSLLLASSSVAHISAIASLNHRLSPHPDFPSEPNTARHPNHINDVLSAIASLQASYAFGSRYVLAGHSAGATLALQVAMSRRWNAGGPVRYASDGPAETHNATPPLAVVGVEGIYDLPLLVARNAHPAYREFVTGAFGADERAWAAVSPVAGEYRDTWEEGRAVVLAHSREDELVGWEQVEAMQRRLKVRGWRSGIERAKEKGYEVVELRGGHDQVWQEGVELARAVEVGIQRVTGMIEEGE